MKRTLLTVSALLLTLLSPTTFSSGADEAAPPSPWPQSLSALSSGPHGVGNGAISVGHGGLHLRNVEFPAGTGNTFLETSGGGQTEALRYSGRLAGLFHGGVDMEGYREANGSLVNRLVTKDGQLSLISQATPDAGSAPAFSLTYWVRNVGNATQSNVTLYGIVEPNANSQREETTSASDGVIRSTNALGAAATLGFATCDATSGRAIGDSSILGQLSNGNLNGATTYTGDSWFIEAVNLGDVAPGETKRVRFAFLGATDGNVSATKAHCSTATQPPMDFYKPERPAAPTNLRANLTEEGTVHLEWDASPDAAYYLVHRGDGSCDRAVAHYAGDQTAFDDRPNAGTYCYFVTASSAAGRESEASNPVTVVVERDPPGLHIAQFHAHAGDLRSGFVYVEVANSASEAARGVVVHVTACPRTTGICDEVGWAYLDTIDRGAMSAIEFEWDTLGAAGEMFVCAHVHGSEGLTRECVTVTVFGISGVGVNLRD